MGIAHSVVPCLLGFLVRLRATRGLPRVTRESKGMLISLGGQGSNEQSLGLVVRRYNTLTPITQQSLVTHHTMANEQGSPDPESERRQEDREGATKGELSPLVERLLHYHYDPLYHNLDSIQADIMGGFLEGWGLSREGARHLSKRIH